MDTREITFRYGSGSARLLVPLDVPIDQLIPEFLEIADVRDPSAGWTIRGLNGARLPLERTLSECDVGDGTVLVLQRDERPPPRSSADQRAAPRWQPSQPSRAHGGRAARSRGRAISERTARTLPARLTTAVRVREALRALTRLGPSTTAAAPSIAGVPDPRTFAVPVRASAFARTREAWRRTDDRYRLEEMILAPRLRRCVTIAVVSPKGGVGKTTTAALLGSLLACLRRDRVVAVDTNPDWGSLGRRLAPGHSVFIDDLLAGPLSQTHPSTIQLDAQLGRGPDGLMIAPAPTEPHRASKLDETAYRTLFARLGELVGTLILDCGTGLDSPAARAALACSDQLVLVADGEPDTASLVAEAAERQFANDAPPLVLLVNKLDRSSRVDVAALERQIDFADGLVLVPNDRAGAEALHGSRFSWSHAAAGWQTAFLELAALLAAGWTRLELAQ